MPKITAGWRGAATPARPLSQRSFLAGLVGVTVLATGFSVLVRDAVTTELATDHLPLSVELRVPSYLPDAELIKHPRVFYSGRWVRARAEFPDVDSLGDVHVELRSASQSFQRSLPARRATPEYVEIELPIDAPTGNYELIVTVLGVTYATSLEISGLAEAELPGGGGAGIQPPGQPPSETILYQADINCRFWPDDVRQRETCYWESVLAGHPTDPNYLIFATSNNDPPDLQPFHVSHDGGRTWARWTVGGLDVWDWCCDPGAVVTPDGIAFYSGLGSFYRGDVAGTSLAHSRFQPRYPDVRLPVDRPVLAYDHPTHTIYIGGHNVYFPTGDPRGPGLFVSRDGGVNFSRAPLDPGGTRLAHAGFPPLASMDTTPAGSLRAAGLEYFGRESPIQARLRLLRFSPDAREYEVAPGPQARYWNSLGRADQQSDRAWIVWTGPKMGIDKAARSPSRGRIYVVWSEPSSTTEDLTFEVSGHYGVDFDVFLAYSDDDGERWSQRLKVNDDPGTADQVFPSLSVDAEGNAHVTFIDKREHPDLPQYDVSYAFVKNGQISENIRVNLEAIPIAGGFSPGDYMDMVVGYPTKAYVLFPCRVIPADPLHRLLAYPSDSCVAAVDPQRLRMTRDLPGIEPTFRRGDANGDAELDVSDAVYTLLTLFAREQLMARPSCEDALDANDDGAVDISDAIFTLNSLFLGGPAPPPPFGETAPGPDLTADALTCEP